MPLIVATLLVSSCASTPAEAPYVEPPADEGAAVIINWGSVGGSTTTCQLPGSSHVCRAWLSNVDGKSLPMAPQNNRRLAAGEHTVSLGCYTSSGLMSLEPNFTSYKGPFKASQDYYIHCVKKDDGGHVWMAATKDGPPTPEFVSVSSPK